MGKRNIQVWYTYLLEFHDIKFSDARVIWNNLSDNIKNRFREYAQEIDKHGEIENSIQNNENQIHRFGHRTSSS